MHFPPFRLTATLLALALFAATGTPARAFDAATKLDLAREVYLELLEAPDKRVPNKLLDNARCIAVIPKVIKGAFVWGGRHGKGVLTCHDTKGWSPPVFVNLSGGSFGFQIGANATDLVLIFTTERGVRSLISSKFTLGADASLAAGPLGRSAEASTDLKFNAEIYSYAKAKGLFAGIAIEGARLAVSRKATRRFYGAAVDPTRALFHHEAPEVPKAGRTFLSVLPQ